MEEFLSKVSKKCGRVVIESGETLFGTDWTRDLHPLVVNIPQGNVDEYTGANTDISMTDIIRVVPI